MPELPEAETIVRGLAPVLRGARVARVEILRPDVVEGDAGPFAEALEGRSFREVGRRGKNVVLLLDDGGRLVVNLGMSGRLLHRAPGDPGPPPTHPAVRCRLEGGDTLIYHDIRRFGRLRVFGPAEYRRWSAGLGPEPLGKRFTAAGLAGALAASVRPVREWLLDQHRVAGVGNIYANEALHRAGIHPATPAARIPAEAVPGLHRALRRVLREAIRSRGTTLRDYRTARGDPGSYAVRLRVYGREGEPCPRCGTPVERIVLGNRSAFFCPACQPPPLADGAR
jgi:formamidopyrimidine-DNA glycosylase